MGALRGGWVGGSRKESNGQRKYPSVVVAFLGLSFFRPFRLVSFPRFPVLLCDVKKNCPVSLRPTSLSRTRSFDSLSRANLVAAPIHSNPACLSSSRPVCKLLSKLDIWPAFLLCHRNHTHSNPRTTTHTKAAAPPVRTQHVTTPSLVSLAPRNNNGQIVLHSSSCGRAHMHTPYSLLPPPPPRHLSTPPSFPTTPHPTSLSLTPSAHSQEEAHGEGGSLCPLAHPSAGCWSTSRG